MKDEEVQSMMRAIAGDPASRTPSIFDRLVRLERMCMILLLAEVAFHGVDIIKVIIK